MAGRLVTGYTQEELIGKPHSIFRHPQTPKEIFKDMWQTISAGNLWSGLLQNRKKNGDSFYIKLSISPLLGQDNTVTEYLSFRDDVTELVRSKKKLQEQFYTDSLTSLGNRNRLHSNLNTYKSPFLAIVHLNHFKQINSFYGEEIGDSVIKKFATKLFEAFYDSNFVIYRFGGVDFALLRESIDDVDSTYEEVTKKLKLISEEPLKIKQYSLDIDLSCGMSCDYTSTTFADMALKISRREKKLAVIFDDSLKVSEEYKNNLLWTSKIKEALHTNNIICYYQPIINNKTKKIDKYESLVRLREADGTIISPFYFLDIAQQSGQYREITHVVIANAFKTFKNYETEFSINLTVADILDRNTRSFLTANLKNIQGSKCKAVIELIESSGIESFEEVLNFINEIKALGAKLAIDDFGTGYSNFEYLLKLEPDYIKIDGSLIKDIDTNKNKYDIVKTITAFAHDKGYQIIAEFVSSESIQNTIDELGIEFSQGYFFSDPKATVF